MATFEEILINTTINLLAVAVTRLPSDVKDALRRCRVEETSEIAKGQLDAILANVDLAEKEETPLCQDTGMPMFYLRAGNNFPRLGQLPRILREAVKRATKTIPLRPNAVHPFTRENSGDNTGAYTPYLHWDIVDGETLELTALPKGFGAEMMSSLTMLTPGEGIRGVKKFVIDTVVTAGARPCPPVIVGIGVGGGADSVMMLARKATLRPITTRHTNPDIAKLEEELHKLVNETGLGPMGLGGKTTALGVNVEYAHTHTAALPTGVILQCWAARKASARIWPDGRVEDLP